MIQNLWDEFPHVTWHGQKQTKKKKTTHRKPIKQNLWDTAKAVVRGKLIAMQSSENKKKIANRQPKLISKATREITNKT